MFKRSFTLRVLAINFLVIALPLLVDSFVFLQLAYYDSINRAESRLKAETNFRAFALGELLPVHQILLQELSYFLDLSVGKQLSSETLSHQLSKVAKAVGNIQIYVLNLGEDHAFKILASSQEALVGTTIVSYEMLQDIIQKGKGSFVRYIYSDSDKRFIPYVFIARVVDSDKTGKPLALIMVSYKIEKHVQSVLNIKGIKDIKFALLNTDGIVFSANDNSLTGNYFNPISSERRQEIQKTHQLGNLTLAPHPIHTTKRDDTSFFEFKIDNQNQIGYRAYLPASRNSLIAYIPEEAFIGKSIHHFIIVYSIFGAILIIGGGVTYWLSRWFSRPLKQLSYLMGEVSKNNFDVKFTKAPLGFEINILGDIFNTTLTNLLENIQQAEDERVKKEIYQRELEIGREAQQSLLPSIIPEIRGAKVAGIYLGGEEVGGDFYDYMRLKSTTGEETLMITVADAAGKGISTCLYALSVRSLIRTYATFIEEPGEILSRANNAFLKDVRETGMFVTAFSGIYHANSKILTYYSSGHIPPIVRRADGQLLTLKHSGMALGLKESMGYASDSIQLQEGDLVVFYTKGLTEAENAQQQFFSEKRLHNFLQQKQWATAQELIEGLTSERRTFIGNVPQATEATMVVLKVHA